MQNVAVSGFYTGCNCSTSNLYIDNFYAHACHIGLSIGNDIKCKGVFGWDVYCLLQMRGSISSAVQVRVDSCVNVVNLQGGSSLVLEDVDGDYCTDSLIFVGKYDGSWANVNSCHITNIHGRCCCLNSIPTSQNRPSLKDMGTETKGYGTIRVGEYCSFYNNSILNVAAYNGNPFDTGDKYKFPHNVFTFGLHEWHNANLSNNYLLVQSPDIDANTDLKDFFDEIIQTAYKTGNTYLVPNISFRLETARGSVFYDNGQYDVIAPSYQHKNEA